MLLLFQLIDCLSDLSPTENLKQIWFQFAFTICIVELTKYLKIYCSFSVGDFSQSAVYHIYRFYRKQHLLFRVKWTSA